MSVPTTKYETAIARKQTIGIVTTALVSAVESIAYSAKFSVCKEPAYPYIAMDFDTPNSDERKGLIFRFDEKSWCILDAYGKQDMGANARFPYWCERTDYSKLVNGQFQSTTHLCNVSISMSDVWSTLDAQILDGCLNTPERPRLTHERISVYIESFLVYSWLYAL